MPQTFETFIASERERLTKDREAIFDQQHDLQTKLDAINNEMRAIDAYEAAKTGKPIPVRGTTTRRSSGTRRGSKRDGVLQLVKGIPA